jgi:ParB-like chromosome segregation protein Spo0J
MDRRIEYRPLGSLAKAKKNPKRHDVQALKRAIERFGFVQPIVVNESTQRIVAGHGRQSALTSLKADGAPPPAGVREVEGEWLVPVLLADFKDEQEAEAFLLADNKLQEIGGWDEKALMDMLKGMGEADADLAVLAGFTEEEVQVAVMGLPEIVRGKTPEDYPFAKGMGIRQLVLSFEDQEYDELIPRLEVLMARAGLASHT